VLAFFGFHNKYLDQHAITFIWVNTDDITFVYNIFWEREDGEIFGEDWRGKVRAIKSARRRVKREIVSKPNESDITLIKKPKPV
jgi:hypothetical protein